MNPTVKRSRQERLTRIYHEMDAEEILRGVARHFRRKFGGDEDDWYSEACLAFIKAVDQYKPGRSDLGSWIRYMATTELLERFRIDNGRNNRLRRVAKDLNTVEIPIASGFDVEELLETLSDDARYVLKATMYQPIDVRLLLLERKTRGPDNVRACVREFFRDLGWSTSKVKNAFDEIKEALA